MSAGTGILHSEFNPSKTEPVHFLQIWIIPDQVELPPSYEQKAFPTEERRGQLRLVAAPNGRDGTVTVRQDARLYVANLRSGERVIHEVEACRGVMAATGPRHRFGQWHRDARGRRSGSRRRAGIVIEAKTDANSCCWIWGKRLTMAARPASYPLHRLGLGCSTAHAERRVCGQGRSG
jgi:redox-sensitive bicupin YhaK (pirin superfamily)